MKTVIISAADSGFFALLSGLVKSIRARRPEPIPHCVLDCGLEPDQRTWLAGQEVSLVTPDWDYSGFEVPGVWFKAMTARPHLPRWVPGYEMYVWIDADAWIQDWSALAKFIAGASEAGVAAVKEADHAYPETIGPTPDRHGPQSTDWHSAVVRSFFGAEVAAKIGRLPLINSGVFAARAESGLWEAWSDALKTALSTARDNLFLSEQTAFNVALLEYGVPFANLPAWCNWACNRAWPLINSAGQLVEPVFPHRPLGIVHMTGETKKGSHPIPVQGGGTDLRTLEYPG